MTSTQRSRIQSLCIEITQIKISYLSSTKPPDP